PKFCSMKISHDIRNQSEEVKREMEKKAKEFVSQGSQIYQP
ncbi:thiamine biosynthesis protein ThiC, partial [Bacillus safensis]